MPETPQPFPAEQPLVDLVGWWLEIRCSGCPMLTHYPFRLMAAELGWRTRLAQVLPRLSCRRCGARPGSLELIDKPQERARTDGKPQTLRLL